MIEVLDVTGLEAGIRNGLEGGVTKGLALGHTLGLRVVLKVGEWGAADAHDGHAACVLAYLHVLAPSVLG